MIRKKCAPERSIYYVADLTTITQLLLLHSCLPIFHIVESKKSVIPSFAIKILIALSKLYLGEVSTVCYNPSLKSSFSYILYPHFGTAYSEK